MAEPSEGWDRGQQDRAVSELAVLTYPGEVISGREGQKRKKTQISARDSSQRLMSGSTSLFIPTC